MPPQIPVLPIGRFSPARGLFVDRTENLVTITGAMDLYGPEATPARTQSIESAINTTWTQTFLLGAAGPSSVFTSQYVSTTTFAPRSTAVCPED